MIHFLPSDRNIQFRSCKRCGIKEYVKTEEKDGQIVSTILSELIVTPTKNEI